MAVVLVLLFALLCAITAIDVRERAIYVRHLLLLACLRVAVALCSVGMSLGPAGEGVPWAVAGSGLQAAFTLALPLERWGIFPLAQSLLMGVAVALLIVLLGCAVSRLSGSNAVGRGDVLLIAACCLFLRLNELEAYLLLVALVGVAMALFWRFAKGSRTFPFAPALVWPCWLLLLLVG